MKINISFPVIVGSLMLAFGACKKEVVNEVHEPKYTTLQRGLPDDPKKLSGILWVSQNFYLPFNTRALASTAYFCDPPSNMYSKFDRWTGGFPPCNVSTGKLSMNNFPLYWSETTDAAYYMYNDFSNRVVFRDTVRWVAEGNKSFVPFDVTLNNSFPVVLNKSSVLGYSASSALVIVPSEEVGEYDEISVVILYKGDLYFKKSYSKTDTIRITQQETKGFFPGADYQIQLIAARFYHITLNDHVYLFETNSLIQKKLDVWP